MLLSTPQTAWQIAKLLDAFFMHVVEKKDAAFVRPLLDSRYSNPSPQSGASIKAQKLVSSFFSPTGPCNRSVVLTQDKLSFSTQSYKRTQ